MTPKQQAEEIVDKFLNPRMVVNIYCAKQCALICVDEIIDALESFSYQGAFYDDFETRKMTNTSDKNPTEYWHNVKSEIENL